MRDTWKVNSSEDRIEIEKELYDFAASQNESFSKDDVEGIIRDYNFMASGQYKNDKVRHDSMWADYKMTMAGDNHHDKGMYKAYIRLLKTNNLFMVFCDGRMP